MPVDNSIRTFSREYVEKLGECLTKCNHTGMQVGSFGCHSCRCFLDDDEFNKVVRCRRNIPRIIIYHLTPCRNGDIYREVVECFNRWEAEILIRQLYEADFSFNCYQIMEVLR